MILSTIKGLPNLITQTPYYKGKRPSEKNVLTDKCAWFINSIILGNRHNWSIQEYEAVPLNKTVLRNTLGRHETDLIIKQLEDLGYIEIDHSYISTSRINKINKKRKSEGQEPLTLKAESKKYGLTDKAKKLGVTKVKVLSQRMEKKFWSHKQTQAKTYLNDKQIHSKILFNLTELHFNSNKAEPHLKEVETKNPNSDKLLHWQESFKTLTRFNDFKTIQEYIEQPQFYYMQSYWVKRVFHY